MCTRHHDTARITVNISDYTHRVQRYTRQRGAPLFVQLAVRRAVPCWAAGVPLPLRGRDLTATRGRQTSGLTVSLVAISRGRFVMHVPLVLVYL